MPKLTAKEMHECINRIRARKDVNMSVSSDLDTLLDISHSLFYCICQINHILHTSTDAVSAKARMLAVMAELDRK